MNRRYLLLGSGAMLRAAAPVRRKVLICLMDGLDPAYIEKSEMPNLRRAMRAGTYKVGTGMMPSLTNVNQATLATGSYPEAHGITANTFFDPALGKIVEMSEGKYLLRPTLFASAHRKGWKTAFVGAKEKIRTLVGLGAQLSIGAEKQGVPMYEASNSYWVFEQGREVLRRPEVDLLYLTTSDYMMHTYAPEAAESQEHLHKVDQILGGILDDHANLEFYLCADHGMNAKTRAVDPERILAGQGIAASTVPAIADAHKVHHKDLGGSLYLDVLHKAQMAEAAAVLRAEPGIEAVIPRAEAARRFRLMPARMGDFYLLADRQTAVGALEQPRSPVSVRTHGSLHERAVPLLVYGRKVSKLETTVDLTATRPWEVRV